MEVMWNQMRQLLIDSGSRVKEKSEEMGIRSFVTLVAKESVPHRGSVWVDLSSCQIEKDSSVGGPNHTLPRCGTDPVAQGHLWNLVMRFTAPHRIPTA
jgi:hypothetical protein